MTTPRSARDVLDPAMDAGEERVRHVLEDQADRRRHPVRAAQRAGGVVVPVAEQLDRALRTLSASSGATGGLPLTTLETVLRLTPATAATSFIVGRRPLGSEAVIAATVPDARVRRTRQTTGISPDPRAISRVGTTTSRAGVSRPASRANSSSPAWCPSS